ncbi:hypothetical protein L7F22_006615 [Adiantum nelumboides]|nr:hypothetical protein [Adiantum nelumboides]
MIIRQMLRGSVIMDVVDTEQARIAKEIGATALMALEWVHADIKTEGGVAQMSNPELIKEIKDAVTIPVMAKAKIGLFVEAQVLEAIGVDYVDKSEVLIPATDDVNHINKHNFCIPFVCGYLIRAWRAEEAFHDLSVQHTVMWTALIIAYVEVGYGDESLYYFEEMQFNDEAEKKGELARDLLVGNTLVDAYAKCGSLSQAQEVFAWLLQCGVVAWTALVSVKKFHADAARRGIAHDVFVGNTLVSMYEKCREFVEVEKVFFKMPLHSVVSWYLMISSYLDDGQGKMALQLFSPINVQGANYNHATSVLAFQACGTLVEKNVLSDNKQSIAFLPLDIGQALHAYLQSKGFAAQRFVANTLVSLYGKCKAMAEAENAFASVMHQDEVSAAYIKQGQELEALQLYEWMQRSSSLDRMSLMVALQACAFSVEIDKGYHEEEGTTVNNIIVSMYGKCGAMKEAEQIFCTFLYHDFVAWNVVLSTYADKEEGYLALQLFKHMQEEHVSPDQTTLITALQTCIIEMHQSMGQCCEMVIGHVHVLVGVAGPLSLNGFEYMVPMATTEGCLVASTNQGCKAICMSGGATSVLLRDGMTRAPIAKFKSAQHAGELKFYNEDAIKFFKQMKCETTGVASTWEVFDRVDKRDDLIKAQAHSKSEEGPGTNQEEAGNRAKRSVITEKEEMKLLWEHTREREEAQERSEQLKNEASQSLPLDKLEKRTQDRKTVEGQVSNMSQEKLPGQLLGACVRVVGYAMKFIYLVIYLGLAIMGFSWSTERENLVSCRTRSREPMRMGNLIMVQGVLVPDSRIIVATKLKLAVQQIMFPANFQGQEDLNQVTAQLEECETKLGGLHAALEFFVADLKESLWEKAKVSRATEGLGNTKEEFLFAKKESELQVQTLKGTLSAPELKLPQLLESTQKKDEEMQAWLTSVEVTDIAMKELKSLNRSFREEKEMLNQLVCALHTNSQMLALVVEGEKSVSNDLCNDVEEKESIIASKELKILQHWLKIICWWLILGIGTLRGQQEQEDAWLAENLEGQEAQGKEPGYDWLAENLEGHEAPKIEPREA